MTVECIEQDIKKIAEGLNGYAFTQNDNGIVDLTLGKRYAVYGTRASKEGRFYLVCTDNGAMPWWMPAGFFKLVDSSEPSNWTTKEGKDDHGSPYSVTSDPLYFGAEEDLEDGTDKGEVIFNKMRIAAEQLDRKATIRDFKHILNSPGANYLDWDSLLNSRDTLEALVKTYAPEFEYLLGKGVTITEYDLESVREALEKKAG